MMSQEHIPTPGRNEGGSPGPPGPPGHGGRAPSSLDWMQVVNLLGPVLALGVVFGAFAIAVRLRFGVDMLRQETMESIIIQTVIVGTAAVGMTLVIIAGGIDLSVGSMIAFSSVAAAWLLTKAGMGPVCVNLGPWTVSLDPLLAVLAGIFAGAACGLFNGLIITQLRIVPFIVTLGTLLIVRGLAKGMAESAPINIDDEWIRGLLRSLRPEDRWQLLPLGGWMMLILAGLFAGLLRYTRLGRHAYAIGSNEQTARLCGVSVNRVKLWVYGLCGACAGLSGVMLLSRQSQGDPTGASGYELDVIAAVVIGGGSLSGGEGSIVGTIIGALIMTVIRTGCNLLGLQPWVTQVVTGAIIVAAVAVDRLRHRRAT